MITIYTINEDTVGVITKDDFVLGHTRVVRTEFDQKYNSDKLVAQTPKYMTFKYTDNEWITFETSDVDVEHKSI